MERKALLSIYSELKQHVTGDLPADVAESGRNFFHRQDIRALFQRLGLVAADSSGERSVEEMNRAIAEIALASGDPEHTVRAVFERSASRANAIGDPPPARKRSRPRRTSPSPRRPTLKQLPHSERPRERLIGGSEEQLTDAELLGIVIGGGTPGNTAVDLARQLLTEYGGFRALATKTIAELQSVHGIGDAKAAQIKAALAIARRFASEPLPKGEKLKGSRDLFHHFRERLRDLKKETFWVVLLDQKHKIIRTEKISEGSLSQSLVHPREAFSPAIRDSAAAVAFVHNHPSRDPEPSTDDIEVTSRLKEVGDMVGIRVLDHVIIGGQHYVSLAERGLLR